MRKILYIILAVAALLPLAGCGNASAQALHDTFSACHMEHILRLADGGNTLIVQTPTTGWHITIGQDVVKCVENALPTPDSLDYRIEHTSALMGEQTASDGDYRYHWSYHPDYGLNLVITAKK